jgi:HEAT repeat protein
VEYLMSTHKSVKLVFSVVVILALSVIVILALPLISGSASATESAVKKSISRASSSDPVESVIGFRELARLGAKAKSAMPFLLDYCDKYEFPDNPYDIIRVPTNTLYRCSDAFDPFVDCSSSVVFDEYSTTPIAEACNALSAIDPNLASEHYLAILQDKQASPSRRLKALDYLTNRYRPEMRDAFFKILRDEDESESLRYGTVPDLCRSDDKEIQTLLSQILTDSHVNKFYREIIAYELRYATSLSDDVAHSLHAVLIGEQYGKMLRGRAGYVLAQHADGALLNELADMLRDSRVEKDIRSDIAEGMGRNGSAKAKEILIRELKDGDDNILPSVIRAASNYNDPEILELIIGHIDNDRSGKRDRTLDHWIKCRATSALGRFDSKKALDKSDTIINDEKEDEEIRRDALLGLAVASSRKSTDLLFHSLKIDKHLRVIIMDMLKDKKFQHPDAYLVEKWSDVLSDAEMPLDCRDMAILSICNCGQGSQKAMDALTNVLKDESPVIRRDAAFVLGRIGTMNEIGSLGILSTDKDKSVSEAAKAAKEKIYARLGDKFE